MQRFYYEQVQCCLVRRRFMIKLLVMNFLTSLLLCISFQFAAAKGWGQQVSLHYKDAKMEDIFEDIHKQTGFNFFFNNSVLDGSKKVTISVDKMALEEALKLMEREQPIRFAVVGKSIVVNRAVQPAVLDTIINPQRSDDGYVLRGVVLGADDAPLSDVTIQLLRTGKGAISTASGEYTLPGVRVGDVLELRYVGYAILQVRVKELRFLEVKMQQAVSELDKVVVQGYGRTTKRFNTGNIVTVTAEEIERQPVANPLQALQGKVPGLVVTQTSGHESAPFKVELRGRSSINRNMLTEPLYIIDGVPLTILSLVNETYELGPIGFNQNGAVGPARGQSPLFSLNPNDIESITVLKDADATAVYGSRGGNGVIVITTKKGRLGKAKLEVNARNGYTFVGRFFEMLNTQEYLAMRREAFLNDGITPDLNNAYDMLAPTWDTTRYTDWQRKYYGGKGQNINAGVSVSGGDKATTFRISGEYTYFTPVNNFTGSNQRVSNQSNLTHRTLNRKLILSFTNYFSYLKSTLINLAGASTLPPNAPPIFNESGKLNYSGWAPISSRYPFSNLLQPYNVTTALMNNQARLQYNAFKGFTITSDLGYSQNRQSQILIYPIASKDPSTNPTGQSFFGSNNGNRLIFEPQIEYRAFVWKGDIHAMIGGSYQYVTQDGNGVTGTGYVNDNLINSIANASSQSGNNVSGQYKYAALFGRLTYNLFKKLTISLTGRRDGSSRFAAGKNFGNFYSAGLSYIFSEEKIFKDNLPFMTFGKIRASYGETGSDQIGDYKYLTRWSGVAFQPYLKNPVYVPTQHANPYLEWQADKKIDASVQLGFWEDRLNIEVGWYRNRSSNQLLEYLLPAATGFEVITSNFPATVQNNGWEFSVSSNVLKGKNLDWNLSINGGLNKNKLVSFPGIEKTAYAYFYKVGYPLNIKKLFHYTGVNGETGEYTYEDINKNGELDGDLASNDNDLIIKDISVKCEGGIGSSFRYKNFDLDIYFQYRIAEGRNAYATGAVPGAIGNQPKYLYEHRWKQPGDNAQFARLTTVQEISDNYFNSSDGVYTDASFIRLNNLSLSYSIGNAIGRKLNLRECKLFIRGQNLFVLTSYKGGDPETQSFSNLPPLSSLVYGLNIAF